MPTIPHTNFKVNYETLFTFKDGVKMYLYHDREFSEFEKKRLAQFTSKEVLFYLKMNNFKMFKKE